MTYDQWKTRNPADDELGPEPEEEEREFAAFTRGVNSGWEAALNAAQGILHYAMVLPRDDEPGEYYSDQDFVEHLRREACEAIASLSKTYVPPKPAQPEPDDSEEPF